VGSLVPFPNFQQAVIWSGGTQSNLDSLSQAYGINDAGVIAGYSSGGAKAATYYGGTTTLIDLSSVGNVAVSYAYDVNDAGQVIGTYQSVGLPSAFMYSSGVVTTIAGISAPAAINSSGLIVGSYGFSGFESAKSWYAGTTTNLGSLGGGWSTALGTNDAGYIVGASTTSDNAVRATMWFNGSVFNLGALDPGNLGTASVAEDINSQNVAVGYSDYRGGGRAALFDSGAVFDLNTLVTNLDGWALDSATSINDAGQIAGIMHQPQVGTFAFLLNPVVPEPETYAMLLAGLGLLGFVARRKKLKAV
jgi:probable HAF family extracellular repeat protein